MHYVSKSITIRWTKPGFRLLKYLKSASCAGGFSRISALTHFVPHIPYDWIFPRVYGVIHHGGSGTTHLGLKYGCATLVIPHIIDQFVWNEIVYEKGAGPPGVKLSKLTMKNLEPKILDLVNDTSYKKNAERLASQMEDEDFRDEIYRSIIGC